MLTASRDRWFSQDYRVFDLEREVARIDQSSWKEAAEVEIGGKVCRIYRESLMGDFVLEVDGAVAVRAGKPSAFRETFTIHHGGESFDLAKESLWKKPFALSRSGSSDGVPIGRISPQGWTFRNLDADLPEDLPLEVRVFVIWLVLLIVRRQNNAAAASSG